MLSRSLLLIVATSGLLISGLAQKKERQDNDALLNNPEMIQITLSQVTSKQWTKSSNAYQTERLHVGDKVKFYLVMQNTSSASLQIPIWNTHLQNQPRLFRDGQLLDYKADVKEMVTSENGEMKSAMSVLRTDSVRLEPNTVKVVETIDLANWYEPLKPGHYELLCRHRFKLGGKWVESSIITFEVDAK